MAFVSGDGMRPSSSSNGLASGIGDQQAQSQDFRASLQQHLLALQQQQSAAPQQPSQAPPPQGLSAAASQLTGSNLLYQQLLAQQLQQQQQQPQAQQTNSQLALQQQLAALQNLPNPPAALLQQQLLQQPGGALGQLGQPAGATPNANVNAALATLLTSNPALLQTLAGAAATPNALSSLLLQLLLPNASNLLQPQSQSLLSLIQLLSNPASALLNYQSLLQQPLQQAAQPTPQVNQIAALTQLLGANAGGANTNWHQLANALGIPTTTTSTDENRAYLDQLLRQVQEQQQVVAAQQPPPQQPHQIASTNNTPRPILSAQNSSNSLLNHAQHSASTSNNSLASIQKEQPVQMMDTSGPLSDPQNHPRSTDRQPSSERLLNAESVQDHISRLISENEAIVEPNPVLLKRRPYNRTNTSNSIASQSSVNDNGSQRGSPSIRSPGLQTRVPTTRSQSLHEASMLNTFRAAGGSLTSGQPVFRPTDRYPHQHSSLTCNFCGLKFPNEAGLEAHEFRCSKKEQLTKQHSQPQLQLNSPSSQAHVQQQFQLQAQLLVLQQQKLLQQQQAAFIAANTAGIVSEASSGRSSAPLNSVDSPTSTGAGKLGFQPVHSSSPTTSESRHPFKKRLFEPTKEVEIVDVVSVNEPQTSAKMPKMDNAADLLDAQRHLISLKLEREALRAEDHHSDQPSSSNTDPNAALIRQLAAQQELVRKAKELVQQQEQAQPQPEPQQRVQSQDATPACSKGMRESIGTALLYIEAKVSDKMPYVVTLSEQITAALKNEGAPPTALCVTPYRNRMRNITQEVFVCLHRPQPMFVLQKKNLSMYSNWQQVQVSPTEASLIEMYFKTYSTKPRVGTKELHRFTLANKDRGQLRLTHSTFWMLVNKHRLQVAIEEQQQNDVGELQNFVEEAEQLEEETLQLRKAETPVQPATFLSPKRDINPFQANTQPAQRQTTSTVTKESKGISLTTALAASKMKPMGGNRVDEVEVYIRGRGRGRYVCERCGIRCKKPSMLKKHLRSHTNIRPFACITCNFSFKTKGNLTKHLCSKAHRRRLAERKMGGNDLAECAQMDEDVDIDNEMDEDRLMIANQEEYDDPNLVKLGILESRFMDDEDKRDDDEDISDNEDIEIDVPQPITSNNINYRRFGQENILVQRDVHTPPTCWMRNLCGEEPTTGWSTPDMDRNCNSAPPVVEVIHGRKKGVSESQAVAPQRFASIPLLSVLESRDELGAQQNFLINDISPPASADAHSSNSLIANFIPLSKQPHENEHARMEKPNSLYFLHAATTGQDDSKKISASMEAFLANDAQDLVCDICDTKFLKEYNLLLHKSTHLIERQQNARARTYQCRECNITTRSKQHLAKHIETVHAGATIPIDDEQATSTSTNANSASNISGPSSNNSSSNANNQILLTSSSSSARSFVCTDCKLGFRTHGVLAKHLRSKNHVKTLSSLGKLPEDALNLIKENGNVLASIDATDSESAYESLFQIIANLKNSQGNTSSPASTNPSTGNNPEQNSSSLECREQLGAQSPGPQTPNGYKFNPTNNSNFNKAFPPLPVGIKRKNDRSAPGERLSPPVRRPRCDTAPSLRPSIEGIVRVNHDGNFNSPSSLNASGYTSPEHAASPLHSLATIATATAHRNASSPSVGNTKTANVWIPPRMDQIDRKIVTPDSNLNGMSNISRIFLEAAAISENVASSRSTEENSEGRSEASTPVHRASVNGIIAASPMPQATRCNVCEQNFDTPCDLQVHLHADHIVMRDGRDFKCPKRHCEKVYPSRESLRAHIIAHYYGGGATPTFDGREESDYATANHIASSPSDLLAGSPQTIKKPSSVQSAATFVPNSSPDAPEESNTTQKHGLVMNGMRAPMFSAGVYNVPRQSPQLARPKSSSSDVGPNSNDGMKSSIPCAICGQHFPDSAKLQFHWVSDHMSQINSRPFVCKECDAGFPSKFQLEAHVATHAK